MRHNKQAPRWFVSRQCYWGCDEEDQYAVEIAYGGQDYANPDMLVAKYAGEGEEYHDPREALAAARSILAAWVVEEPLAHIEVGATGGNTIPFEDHPTDEELDAWAQKRWDTLPKCDRCGDVMDPDSTYRITDDPDFGAFCSEYCAETAYADSMADCEELA